LVAFALPGFLVVMVFRLYGNIALVYFAYMKHFVLLSVVHVACKPASTVIY
jgi:hypothetical protein